MRDYFDGFGRVRVGAGHGQGVRCIGMFFGGMAGAFGCVFGIGFVIGLFDIDMA